MEDLAEGALKGLLRIIGLVVRSIIWLIWEFCFEEISWYIGWPVCRLITIGKLPRTPITERDNATHLTIFLVSMTGVLSLLTLGIVIAKLAGST